MPATVIGLGRVPSLLQGRADKVRCWRGGRGEGAWEPFTPFLRCTVGWDRGGSGPSLPGPLWSFGSDAPEPTALSGSMSQLLDHREARCGISQGVQESFTQARGLRERGRRMAGEERFLAQPFQASFNSIGASPVAPLNGIQNRDQQRVG